jgi:hypothetical protein
MQRSKSQMIHSNRDYGGNATAAGVHVRWIGGHSTLAALTVQGRREITTVIAISCIDIYRQKCTKNGTATCNVNAADGFQLLRRFI